MLLLTSNFSAVLAKPETNATLPDFLEKVLVDLHPNATSTELNQIRTQWANQLKINQEHASRAPQPLSSVNTIESTTMGAHYYMTWARGEAFWGGSTYNENGIIGPGPDNNKARILTPIIDAHATIYGEMNSQYAWGYVQAYAAEYTRRPDGKDNYLMVWASNSWDTPAQDWTFIGYKQITSLSCTWYYIGFNPNYFKCWGFGCWATGGADMFNDIIIDCVAVTPIV